MKKKIREIIFNGFKGCTNHFCIINGNCNIITMNVK